MHVYHNPEWICEVESLVLRPLTSDLAAGFLVDNESFHFFVNSISSIGAPL